jgi:hypothetical protein
MQKMTIALLAGLALSTVAGTVSGATLNATGSLSLYGQSYTVKQWRTLTDAGTTAFDPEALTFYNGTLYANGDEGGSAGNGRLVSYVPGATGDLTSASFVTMGTNGAARWGGEGITVNTSGSGFGSFGPGGFKIASVDSRGSNATGAVINVDSANAVKPLSNIISLPETDDIVWVSSRNQFGLVLDVDGSIAWYDNNMVATGQSVGGFNGAKGISVVSAAWVQNVFGLTSATAQVLLVVGKETNRLGFFDTDGNAVGSLQDLLPTGVTFSEIEAVAVDEANNNIYLADEAALSIHVINVPTPGAALILAVGGLVATRRRR